VAGFVAAGGNELVLSGINLGRWGRDLAVEESGTRLTFAALVRQILDSTGLPRLRLSSIEPMDWDNQLIGLMAEFGGTRLARHAHLPLQSGSDTVLRRMHRRYRPWHYVEKASGLAESAPPVPELTFGADVMAGFPGETDARIRADNVVLIELTAVWLSALVPLFAAPRHASLGAFMREHPVPPGRCRGAHGCAPLLGVTEDAYGAS
jgi:threonylcarbamoyladenosine tRNA methylthiotransferase MtaB